MATSEGDTAQPESAEQFKLQGNEFFKKKEFNKAIQAYSEAIGKALVAFSFLRFE
jgi:hypothetical protein